MVEIGRVGDTRQAIALTQRGADDYLLLIFAVVAVLAVFAFAAEGSSQRKSRQGDHRTAHSATADTAPVPSHD
jgi:hypothetical protein